jgi:hypothetical protein
MNPGRSVLPSLVRTPDPVRMFVRYHLDVSAPFEHLEAVLLDGPERWLPGLFEDAEDRGSRLLADVGFSVGATHRAEKQVEVAVGEPFRMPGKTLLPIAWTASGGEPLFPSLEGDLEVAALGERRTQLSISARYRPPLGAVGRMLDRALLHRVAESSVKDFLDRVAETLAARSPLPA